MLNLMIKGLNATFTALSDPTRRSILSRLTDGRLRITELAAPLPISLAATSKHIKILERAGLVIRDVRGRDHYISLNPMPLAAAADWIESHRTFWESRLNVLASYLGEGDSAVE